MLDWGIGQNVVHNDQIRHFPIFCDLNIHDNRIPRVILYKTRLKTKFKNEKVSKMTKKTDRTSLIIYEGYKDRNGHGVGHDAPTSWHITVTIHCRGR